MSVAKPTIRLQAAADLPPLEPDTVVADVATGRAELALYLASSHRCARVIAIDSSPRAIAIAEQVVRRAGLQVPVELRVGDGLGPLARGEADVIFITGVGGRLIIRLLNGSDDGAAGGLARLVGNGDHPVVVLQPMSEPKLVRRWAESRGSLWGYRVAAEQLVVDAGRFYHTFVLDAAGRSVSVMNAASPSPEWDADAIAAAAGTIAWDEVGPYLLAGPDPLLLDYLVWRQAQLERLAREATAGDSDTGYRRAAAALTVLAALARLEIALRQVQEQSRDR